MAAKKDKDGLEFQSKYTYNRDTDTYVVPMRHRTKPFVISGYKMRAIRRAITNTIASSETSAQVRSRYKILADDLEGLKKAFDLTRDAFPLTDEELVEQSIEQSVDQLLEEKRATISQALEKESWKETQKFAKFWLDFQSGILDPVANVLDSWVVPKLAKKDFKIPKVQAEKQTDGKTLVIGLSDIHYGCAASKKYMFYRPDWSTEKTVECVDRFCTQIISDTIAKRTYRFDKAIILGLGDLIHSLNGKTTRGTELKFDRVREEQFEFALSSLTVFISRIADVIGNVEVHSVYGNHNYETEMALFRALDCYFNNNPAIKFFHYSSRPATFKTGTTLFIMDHGADSVERAYVPLADNKLKEHVQDLLLASASDLLVNVKEKLFVQGDKHHWEHREFTQFQFIMFGTLLGGDEHSNVHNLRNRPRQSCLVLDNSGLVEVIHCYFD